MTGYAPPQIIGFGGIEDVDAILRRNALLLAEIAFPPQSSEEEGCVTVSSEYFFCDGPAARRLAGAKQPGSGAEQRRQSLGFGEETGAFLCLERLEPSGEIQSHLKERILTGRDRGRNVLAQREAERGLGELGVLNRLVPALAPFFVFARRPGGVRHGLERHPGDALVLGFREDLQSEIAFLEQHEVHGKEDGIKREAVHQRDGRFGVCGPRRREIGPCLVPEP